MRLPLASCASKRPIVYSDSTTVSAAEIQRAIELVQQRCLRERHGLLPVYRIDLDLNLKNPAQMRASPCSRSSICAMCYVICVILGDVLTSILTSPVCC